MRPRRALALVLAVPAIFGVLAVLAALWLVATPSGLRVAARVAQTVAGRLAPVTLELEEPDGTLLGPLHLGRIRVKTAGQDIEVQDINLTWQPRRLLDGLLLADALEVGSLQVAIHPSEENTPPPTDLSLPLAVRVERIRIGHASVGPAAEGGSAAVVELTAIEGRLASDGRHHSLEALRLATARLAVEGSATLDGQAPFALSAAARITGEEAGHPFTVALDAGGRLEDMTLQARSTSGALQLDGKAELTVFTPQLFRRASLTATGLDPAAWVEGAPRAQLQVEAWATPDTGNPDRISGEVSVVNGEPGRLDADLMPLRSLQARFQQDGGRIQVPNFTARLSTGELAGSARWADGEVSVDARLTDVDAAAWHKALQKTRLAGSLKLQAAADIQRVQAQLTDPRFALSLDATRRGETIQIAEARVSSKGGSLELTGEVAGDHRFTLKGKLDKFDPALFVDIPHSRLNAALDAKGQFGEQQTMDLHFVLDDSVVAGRPLAGHGDVVLRPQRLERAELSLRAGDNRIEAHGSLGAAKDVLTLAIDAPHLEQVGLGGAARGEVALSGRLTAPNARWTLDAPRLGLPGQPPVQDVHTMGHWETDGDSIQATLSVGAAEVGGTHVTAVSAGIEGHLSQHRLQAQARVGEAHTLVLAASGGVDPARTWRGQIETLAWQGPNPVRLTGSTTLEAGAGHVALGQATIAGEDWQATLARLRWEAGRLQTSGRVNGLPVDLLPLPPELSTTLRVGAEWDIDLGDRADGMLHVFRQSGDVVLDAGEEGLALGLSRMDLEARLGGQQAKLTIRADGAKTGTLEGQLTASLHREDSGWTLARQAPWQGSLRLDSPSLAWLSPLAGANVRLDGRLQASVELAGTPAAPTTHGQIIGSSLRVRLLDYGLDLGGGSLHLDLTPETARLQRLELTSVATQAPLERRIDYSQLTAKPGTLTAEGELTLGNGNGRIRLHADRLAVSQLPDRWAMVSGTGDVGLMEGKLTVGGDLKVDAAYVELTPAGQPTLSSDVVVLGREKKPAQTMPVSLDLNLDLGRRFYFRGSGVDARLAGALHLAADSRGRLRANGSVRTVDGKFDAYGRQLAIERGILNFQGQADNPGLNVLALRKNLPVEAGVEVTGTVNDPKVRLVSEPDVPDSEKLSWMVLGHAPGGNYSGQDADLLLTAAMALRGNQGKGPLESLTRGLGLDELGVSSGTLSDSGTFPTSHVAGNFYTNGTTAAEQIATVGKRIGTNTVVSYERSLTTAESIVKLTVELTRRLSIVGRVGAENGIGLNYSFRFGGPPPEAPAGGK